MQIYVGPARVNRADDDFWTISALKSTGLSESEARRQVRQEFGGIEQVKEQCRESCGTRWLEDSYQDLHLAIRMLLTTRVWTAVACLILVFGISLSTAIFSVVYSVLLQPLHYPDADWIVAVWLSAPKAGFSRFYVNAAHWLDWEKHSTLLESIALTRPAQISTSQGTVLQSVCKARELHLTCLMFWA